jgi:hypothetical protein
MKCRARRWLLFALLIGGLLAFSGRAVAQPRVPRIDPQGVEAFRLILHGSGLKPIQELEDLEAKAPENTLIIVFGRLDVLKAIDDTLPRGLKGFLGNGGAILIASDRAASAQFLQQEFKVVPSETVVHNRNAGKAFGGKDTFPFITVFPHPRHPLFRGVKQLATNAPAYLIQQQQVAGLHVLARFTEGCTDDRGWQLQGNPVYALGNDAAVGTRLILGGHGVFMNDEMYNKDNILFARNCVDWFTRSKDGKKIREEALFYLDGDIIKKFKVPLRRLPLPPLPTIQKINRLIGRLEAENFFNKFALTLAGPPGVEDKATRMTIGKERILRWLGIGLGLVVLLHLFRKLWGSQFARDPRVLLLASNNVSEHVSTEPLIEQRQRGMLYEGNLWEAARELARQCFTEYADRALSSPPPRPEVVVRGSDQRRPTFVKRVRQLWDLAYGPPTPVPALQFRHLVGDAEEVKEALASGALVLQEPPPTGKTQPPPHLGASPALS